MSDLIRRQDAIDAVFELSDKLANEMLFIDAIVDEIENLPPTESETITIEEVSNQLGCATIQSALYWFEFLKTLDLLGFAIIRKETR